MCQFKGTSGEKAMLAGKSTHRVDEIGEFTGMNIVTSKTRRLKRSTEREAWIAGQKSAVRMLDYYKRKALEGDEVAAGRIDATRAVIQGYVAYTQVDPLPRARRSSLAGNSPRADAGTDATPGSPSRAVRFTSSISEEVPDEPASFDGTTELVAGAVAAAAESRERDRVALPMQMEAFSPKVVLSDSQYRLYKKHFNAIDQDGSGVIERSEVVTLLTAQMGKEPRPEQVESFLAKFDENQDGAISLEEWIAAVVGKEFAVSSLAADEIGGSDKDAPTFLDMNGDPMAMGLIYVFAGGG